ncbi:MAG: flagellar hook-associated protein FlgK [Planctomycetota bacterium]
MAILGASFQIGRSALAAYQAAIAITGQNIANLGNPDYARQSGRLAALYGGMTSAGIAPGTGVNLSGLSRHVDLALEAQLRSALGARAGAQTTYQTLNRIEGLYNELTDQDLSTQLTQFFAGFAGVQTDPLESSARRLVISNADAVIGTMQRHRRGLLDQVQTLNATVEQVTSDANGLAREVAHLNELVVTAESRGQGGANALRDRRDALLRQLGELMDIQTREQDNGIVNVYVGSEPLVDFNYSRGLKTVTVLEDGLERASIRFADNNGSVLVRGGKLGAAVTARDVHVASQLDQLDRLAGALIYEVNRAHASGQGLIGLTSATGTYAARDAKAALNSMAAGLPFPIQNGTFVVRVKDQATGQVTTTRIEVDLDGLDADTSLADLAAALNQVPGLGATVTPDNRLRLEANSGCEFTFADDTSGALAALGVGTFFEGVNASTIAVNAAVRADPRLIAASAGGAPGDGDNAGRLAQLGSQASALLGNISIEDYRQGVITALAVETAGAETAHEAADAVYSSLLAQREAISGVNLDEEAINLTKFERSFQGASRFLGVLDSLADEVLALVQP